MLLEIRLGTLEGIARSTSKSKCHTTDKLEAAQDLRGALVGCLGGVLEGVSVLDDALAGVLVDLELT